MPFSFGDEAVNEGEFVQVTCNIKRGDLPLKISWSLKGDIVSSEPAITTTMIGTRTSILMINSVGYRHSGEYTCIAQNKAGSSYFSTDLKVNGRESVCVCEERRKGDVFHVFVTFYTLNYKTLELFPDPPKIGPFSFPSEIVDEGTFAQITCSVTRGDEPLKISWHLHGDVISSEPSITTTMIGTRTSILIIQSVGYRHSGIYSCRAQNPAGSDTYSAELKVNGRVAYMCERD